MGGKTISLMVQYAKSDFNVLFIKILSVTEKRAITRLRNV